MIHTPVQRQILHGAALAALAATALWPWRLAPVRAAALHATVRRCFDDGHAGR